MYERNWQVELASSKFDWLYSQMIPLTTIDEKTQHNCSLMGLLTVTGFLMYIHLRSLKVDKCLLAALQSVEEAYEDNLKK